MTEPFLGYCPLADSLYGNMKEIREIEEYADLVWSCASVGIRKAGEKAKLPVEKRERTKTPYMIY